MGGLGFKVSGSGLGAWGFGVGFYGFGCWCLGISVQTGGYVYIVYTVVSNAHTYAPQEGNHFTAHVVCIVADPMVKGEGVAQPPDHVGKRRLPHNPGGLARERVACHLKRQPRHRLAAYAPTRARGDRRVLQRKPAQEQDADGRQDRLPRLPTRASGRSTHARPASLARAVRAGVGSRVSGAMLGPGWRGSQGLRSRGRMRRRSRRQSGRQSGRRRHIGRMLVQSPAVRKAARPRPRATWTSRHVCGRPRCRAAAARVLPSSLAASARGRPPRARRRPWRAHGHPPQACGRQTARCPPPPGLAGATRARAALGACLRQMEGGQSTNK